MGWDGLELVNYDNWKVEKEKKKRKTDGLTQLLNKTYLDKKIKNKKKINCL